MGILMKSWIGLLSIFVLAVNVLAGGADPFRDFLSTDGKAMRGRVMRFDAREQKVTIERDTKKVFTVPVSVFCEDDQTYIFEWNQAKDFLSESAFKISASRFEKKLDEGYSSYMQEKKVEDCGYEITLENKSKTLFKNVSLQYCIYYEQDEIEKHKQITEEGVLFGTLAVGDMLAKNKRELKTETVIIYKRSLDADYIYTSNIKNVQKGKIHGVWLKATMKTETGQTFTREYMLPDSLSNKRAWSEEPVYAGENRAPQKKKKKKKKK